MNVDTKFAVAIPVYNEAAHVKAVVARVKRYCPRVLVVDDGSSDATVAILAGIDGIEVIRHRVNRGYGRALISAFNWARAKDIDWLITMDCDGQHEPELIPAFMARALADDVDIVSGSRYLPEARRSGAPPAARRAINYEITGIINERLDLGITDAFCGFKAYRVAVLEALELDEEGYAMPLQFWARAAAQELRIAEIPVTLIYNDPDRTFGGRLDDSGFRRRHYLEVFERALGGEVVGCGDCCDCDCKSGGCCCG